MHSSLTVQSNLVEMGACALVAVGTVVLGGPFPGVPWVVSAVLGVVVGTLRSRSLWASPRVFQSAQTSLEVRTAMMSTRVGRIAVIAQWIAIPIVVVVAWEYGNLLGGGLGGLAVFIATRDAATLKGVLGLASESEPSGS